MVKLASDDVVVVDTQKDESRRRLLGAASTGESASISKLDAQLDDAPSSRSTALRAAPLASNAAGGGVVAAVPPLPSRCDAADCSNAGTYALTTERATSGDERGSAPSVAAVAAPLIPGNVPARQ
mmetsp:Transcript_21306/g.66079  ORF Transcript_21306/g.66079 Transcript_21306/m.66079 type:complete len:125 (+) Transcript_21306:160-534(+)